jgi:ribosome biogenesis GTPase
MSGPLTASSLVELGWGGPFEALFADVAPEGSEPARVVATHRETAIVRTGGSDLAAHVSGRFRRDALLLSDYPAVGDWVAIEPRPAERSATIHAIVPRRSAITRSASDSNRRATGRLVDEQVLAANVDVAFLVAAIDRDPNLARLERYLALAWGSGATPVVLLNKVDQAADPNGALRSVEGIAIGVDVHPISALTGAGVEAVTDHLAPGRTAVVLGPSGVGKSTLANALLGSERQVTSAVRASDARGRHTTTHRELIPLPSGAMLIDTPGIRSLELLDGDGGVESAFAEIQDLAADCRFADCAHRDEPGCAVRAALEDGSLDRRRWGSYEKLRREAAHQARSTDVRAREAEKRRWQTIHKSVRVHMRRKYGEAAE